MSALDLTTAGLARSDRPVRGIAAMLLTVLAFTAHDAGVKLLGTVWPLPQIVLGAGLLAATAFSLQAVSLRAARAAVIAPFQDVQILFGLAVGAVRFGDPPPDQVTALGAPVVIGSGLDVLHRATRRRGAGG